MVSLVFLVHTWYVGCAGIRNRFVFMLTVLCRLTSCYSHKSIIERCADYLINRHVASSEVKTGAVLRFAILV